MLKRLPIQLVALVLLLQFFHAPSVPAVARMQASATEPGKVVYLCGKMSDESLVAMTTAAAAGSKHGLVLIDSVRARPYAKAFLESYQPSEVVSLGRFIKDKDYLEEHLGQKLAAPLDGAQEYPDEAWQRFFPRVERVVVSPAEPRRLLLQASCLAGVLRAPLFLLHEPAKDRQELVKRLTAWKAKDVLAVGSAIQMCRDLPQVRVRELGTEAEVAEAYLEEQARQGPITTAVVCNPADVDSKLGRMSLLAPWLALERRAALLFTNEEGADTAGIVKTAVQNPRLAKLDAIILAAGLKAIPMAHLQNPIPGKDHYIETEPLVPGDEEPYSFAVGRLFHDDLAVLTLILARERLLTERKTGDSPLKALLVSNPGSSLRLMETFSRHTALEFKNNGYDTTALFERQVSRDKLHRLMPGTNVFLWEGHYRTFVDRYKVPTWSEPMQPSLVFLQSCLALNAAEAQPFLRRGAYAVVGSSSRTYSATGGAVTLAFFDALLYDHQSLGGSLRQAKNFLLAYARLKERRLGDNARLGGANLRSAWAFTLWGDPTFKLPTPALPGDVAGAVHHRVTGHDILLQVPDATYPKVSVGNYQAQLWPNGRLAGLLDQKEGEDEKQLVPLLFAEINLTQAPPNKPVKLTSKLSSSRWTFLWDPHRRTGYLLVIPHTGETGDITFHWTAG